MIDNLDISEIPVYQDLSSVSKQSSFRQTSEQTSLTLNPGELVMTYQGQMHHQHPQSQNIQTRGYLQNNPNGSIGQINNHILQSPTSFNAPLPPSFKRENVNQHSMKRSRQPIFGNPSSNSLSRNQSPSSNLNLQNNLSSGNLQANSIRVTSNKKNNTSTDSIKTETLQTCTDQSNNQSSNQVQGSLIFRKFKESFEKNDPKPIRNLQSPYLNIERNDTESFVTVNSNQNIGVNTLSSNDNVNQITRRIFSNTQPIQINSPTSQQQTINIQPVLKVESQTSAQESNRQLMDLKAEMMKYAQTYFSLLKQDIKNNNLKIEDMQQSVQNHQQDLNNKIQIESQKRIRQNQIQENSVIIENKVQQAIEQKFKKIEKNQKDLTDFSQNVKKEVKVILDQQLKEALKGKGVNSMAENKIDILKQDLDSQLRFNFNELNNKCKLIENKYQNSQLFQDLNEFTRNKAGLYENKLINLENLLNQFRKQIEEKINIGEIKGEFKEIVERKASRIEDQIDELKRLPKLSNSSQKIKSENEQKLKEVEKKFNEQIYKLESELKMQLNNNTIDGDRIKKLDDKILRFNQDMKALQTWYTRLNQDCQQLRENNDSNKDILKQFEEIKERISLLSGQSHRLSNTHFKYENNDLESLYREIQKISKNLHEIDEFKKQKFELLERKLTSSKEEMDKKVQSLISSINLKQQPLQALQSISGIRIKMKQKQSPQSKKHSSENSSDSQTNSTQKSVNTTQQCTNQGTYETIQNYSENYSNKNSIICSANNSYVYNNKSLPIVNPPARQPLQITQISSYENINFNKNNSTKNINQKESITDEQILINSNKHLRTSSTLNKQAQNNQIKNENNTQSIQYNFQEHLKDEEDENEQEQKIVLNLDSDDDYECDESQIQLTSQRTQITQSPEKQKPQQFSINNNLSQKESINRNPYQTHSIVNKDLPNPVCENVYNPLENNLNQNQNLNYINNSIQNNSINSQLLFMNNNKQYFINQDFNNQNTRLTISHDSDPINFDQLDGCQINSSNTPSNRISQNLSQQQQQMQQLHLQQYQQDQTQGKYANSSNTQSNITQSNEIRQRQNSLGTIQTMSNKTENLYNNQHSDSQYKKSDSLSEAYQRSQQIKDPLLPKPNSNNFDSNGYQNNLMQSLNKYMFSQQYQNESKLQQMKEKEDSFGTPIGSLNNSCEIVIHENQQQTDKYQSQIYKNTENKQNLNDKYKGFKQPYNSKPQDKSQNLEDLLDQFEDFNENNIDAMSRDEEDDCYYDQDEEDDQIFTDKNQDNKFNKTQGLSALKNIQLNQINEEENEEESQIGNSQPQLNKLSINSHKNNIRNSDISIGNNLRNSTQAEYYDIINQQKQQNNVYKIVDQIQKLLEIKNEKKLRCYRDEVGYLKDANGFYIFDNEGRMIKTDKEQIKYLQNEGYVQIL